MSIKGKKAHSISFFKITGSKILRFLETSRVEIEINTF